MDRCTLDWCQDEHKARGLCRRHYAQSDRRRRTADIDHDHWDWPAHVSTQPANRSTQPTRGQQPPDPNFTDAPQMSRENLPGGSPPGGAQGYGSAADPSPAPPECTEGDAGPVARSVTAVIAKIPADKRGDPVPVLARALAQLMDVAPAPSTARELRAVMKEVTAMAKAQEVSAVASIRDELAARRAARESAASA